MGSLFKLKYIIQLNGKMTEKELMDALRTRNGNLEIAISRFITKEMNYKRNRKRPTMKTGKKQFFEK